jgi:putative ABC transport system ATP-binding protein
MNAVTLEAVGKTYRLDAVGVAALTDIDLQIRSGRLTVISGASGSGKTTLLNLIGCIDRPDQRPARRLRAGDRRARRRRALRLPRAPPRLRLPELQPAARAQRGRERRDAAAARRHAGRARRARVESLLAAVGLADQARQRPSQLSGGQRQRVAIARALAAEPQLVLADEPTANLDSSTGASIIALMRRLQREQQVSFVISSHDPQMLAEADDAVMIATARSSTCAAAPSSPSPPRRPRDRLRGSSPCATCCATAAARSRRCWR